MPELYAIGIVVVMLATCGAAYVFGYCTRRANNHCAGCTDALAGALAALQRADLRLDDYEARCEELQRYRDAFGELPGSVDAKW